MIPLSEWWRQYTSEERKAIVRQVIAMLDAKMAEANFEDEIVQDESALSVPCFRLSETLLENLGGEVVDEFVAFCRLNKTEILFQQDLISPAWIIYFVTKEAYFKTIQKFPWLLRGEK